LVSLAALRIGGSGRRRFVSELRIGELFFWAAPFANSRRCGRTPSHHIAMSSPSAADAQNSPSVAKSVAATSVPPFGSERDERRFVLAICGVAAVQEGPQWVGAVVGLGVTALALWHAKEIIIG
jgi:hypothetical protein